MASRDFFGHIDRPMKTMANLVSQRRTPSEIMAMLIAADIKAAAQGNPP